MYVDKNINDTIINGRRFSRPPSLNTLTATFQNSFSQA